MRLQRKRDQASQEEHTSSASDADARRGGLGASSHGGEGRETVSTRRRGSTQRTTPGLGGFQQLLFSSTEFKRRFCNEEDPCKGVYLYSQSMESFLIDTAGL